MDEQTAQLAFCEPSNATAYSRIHIREVGPEGLLLGGGITNGPLCGCDLRLGWDLREATTDEIRGWLGAVGQPGWRRDINPICTACAEAALQLLA